MISRILLLLAVAAFYAGSPAQAGPLRNWIVQRKMAQQMEGLQVPEGVRVLRDIPYGSHPRQRMDVYLPAQASKAPVLFMVHGGGWRIGEKGMKNVVENKVARWVPRGFLFISINYRLLPEAGPLVQADDVAKALATAQAKAEEWGGDPTKFILMGHSAGAHLVSLLTAAPDRAFAQGAKPWLGTVSLDSAAIDVVQIMERKHLRLYDDAFGTDRAFWETASPLHVLTKEAPPMLLVCSTVRPDKPAIPTRNFAEKAVSMGLRAEVVEEPLSHEKINETLGEPNAYTTAVELFMGSLDPAVKTLLNR